MRFYLFLQSIDEPFIADIVQSLQKDIDTLEEIDGMVVPEISSGYYVMLRVYPQEDFKYPARANQVATYSKKSKEITVSTNIELEDLIGKRWDEIYNIFLEAIIGTLFIIEKKKITSVSAGDVKIALETLRQ